MSKRKLVAIHEIHRSLKSKPIAPGKTFTSEDHEKLVAMGAAKYLVEAEETNDSASEGSTDDAGASVDGGNGSEGSAGNADGTGSGGGADSGDTGAGVVNGQGSNGH